MSVVLAMIAERHPAGSAMRERMEAWAKENIPSVLKEGNGTGDLVGAFNRYTAYLQVLLSQKEADRDLKEEATGSEANRKAVSDALAAGNVREALETKVYYLLKAERYRNLQHPDIQKLIELAALAGDDSVFIRLGRALSQPAEIRGPEDMQVDKLKFVLVEWWLRGPQGQMGLCRLTDEALTEFCNLAFGGGSLTLDCVRKTRQRLGLVKGTKPWFNRVEKTSEGIAVSVDE